MCVFKVANPRNNGDIKPPRVAAVERESGRGGHAYLEESVLGPMFPGHNREEEMSVMVSALTHVVSGEVSNWRAGGDLSSSGGDVGAKRGRQEEGGRSSSGGEQFSESSSRVCRAYSDFSPGGSSSNIRG